ncbi:KdsC family phosphatase [Leptospirillum ferriphilum]|jgi:3-deoxy-D-manno-octulosonate 8-phosphate phosphatase (KDO 8-P phosphatase)|uniref:3-deoxy-D-manno-octulosonate 8-phosphate phosphatase n=2 Tax=Leptospirillum TaxID=179 RepID=A0A094YJA8_9BACT|nr:HAD-IIIA family hydrolase [Leptospirillum ferriphilum]EDZ38101.1 MAG: Phosphatase kdsC [Leptospirillum sp. Group II '5-way CG']KGA93296.1 3-deoxy-D-manno-octulosonate 8-phosphate phosphatase [Leptospirillum ferriphilum]
MGASPSPDVLRKLRLIRGVVLDADGILTDGTVFYGDGSEQKAFHIRDGHGLVLMKRLGLFLGVISGRSSEGLARRLDELGIPDRFLGVREKSPCLEELVSRWGVPVESLLYMGDDVVDLSVMRSSGISVTVPEAPFALRREADWVTRAPGGRGAVREVSDWICFCRTGDSSFLFSGLRRGTQ